jgi:ketosteroid isomerase-like protein
MATVGHAALEVVARYLDDHDPRYLAEDVTLDVVAEPRPLIGRAAVAGLVHDVRHRLFTEVDDQVTSLRAVGDEVVAKLTFRARPVPARWGSPVTGRCVDVRAVAVCVVCAGEIAQVRLYYDAASLRRALRQEQLVPLA